MNLRELRAAATAVLAANPSRRQLEQVSGMASCLAEMVGWAPGAIDPRGEARAELDRIRWQARQAFESGGPREAAVLHDAIAGLMDAIAMHDRDLQTVSADDEEVIGDW